MWETGWCFWQIGQDWNHCQLIAAGRDSVNNLLAQRSGCYARQDGHLLRLLDEIDNLVDWRRGNFSELVKSIEKCGRISDLHIGTTAAPRAITVRTATVTIERVCKYRVSYNHQSLVDLHSQPPAASTPM
jgi:hypothetical protein